MDLNKLIEIVKSAKDYALTNIDFDDVELKGVADIVTKTDKAIETHIRTRLSQEFPDVAFIGEETGYHDVDFSKPCFVLDPIDGTTNYVQRLNLSAIALAYIENNEVVAGVVYNPFNDELFSASKGNGAYLNGKQIKVSDKKELKDALVTFGTTPYEREMAPVVMDNVLNVFKNCLEVRRLGSAALDICYVACGRFDAYFEMGIKLWDYAGASIIAKEAGAVFVDYEGNEISFGYKTNVVCGVRAIVDQITELVKSE